ncbi:RNA-binding protein [Lacibacterium aquatile]|uniref:RNA-binding protein n=1 Tax=Lacibacterium aquatile TaxID=1168082 RepID=A0ABW5DWF7_9PROT
MTQEEPNDAPDPSDDLPELPESGPHRRCVGTGEVKLKDELVRCVVAPDGSLVPDLDGKLPGRGLYISPDLDAIAAAVKKKGFARAAKRAVQVPDDLAARLERLIAGRCGSLLGLARRGGQVAAGYDQAESLLRNGKAALLLQAVDAAEGGRSKLANLAKAVGAAEWSVLTAVELAAPFGRDHLVHVAVARGGLASRLKSELTRLSGLRAKVG